MKTKNQLLKKMAIPNKYLIWNGAKCYNYISITKWCENQESNNEKLPIPVLYFILHVEVIDKNGFT